MSLNKEAKILLLAGKGVSSTILYNFLTQHFSNITCIVEEKPDRWKFIKRRAKRLGWFTAIGQVIFQVSIPKILTFFSKKRIKELDQAFQINRHVIPEENLKRVTSINAKSSRELIQQIQPDLIILNGTRIVSKKILRAVPVKFINTHLGITPIYRGVHGGYWAMAKGQPELFGATVHLVDEGIDTGGILKQVTTQPTTKDNFSTYPLLQLAVALPLIVETVQEILSENSQEIEAPSGQSQLWYHPTIFQYFFNYLSKGVR